MILKDLTLIIPLLILVIVTKIVTIPRRVDAPLDVVAIASVSARTAGCEWPVRGANPSEDSR